MRSLKRFFSFLLCLALLLSACACSGGKTNSVTESIQTASKTYDSSEKVRLENVYLTENIKLPEELVVVRNFACSKDKYFVSGYYVKDEIDERGNEKRIEEGFAVYAYDKGSDEAKQIYAINVLELNYGSSKQIHDIFTDPDGNLWVLLFCSETVNATQKMGRYFKQVLIDGEGNVLKEEMSLIDMFDNMEYSYCNIKDETATGKYVLLLDYLGNVFVISYEGQVQFVLLANGGMGDSIFTLSDGTPVVAKQGITGEMEYDYIDSTRWTWGDVQLSDGPVYNSVMGNDGILYINSYEGIYSYDMKTKEKKEQVNWANSCIDPTVISDIYNDGDNFYIMETAEKQRENDTVQIKNFSRLVPASVDGSAEKYVLTYACDMLSDDVLKQITAFNRTHNECMIRPVVYEAQSEVGNVNYLSASMALDMDIINGNIPDIFSIGGISIEKYSSKGLLADLTPYFENDEDIAIEDYLENIFDCIRTEDGKIYYIVPAFQVHTAAAKTSLVGTEPDWSFEDMKKLRAEHPDSWLFNGAYSYTTILKDMLMASFSRFVDVEAGTCDFDNDDFEELLNMCAAKHGPVTYWEYVNTEKNTGDYSDLKEEKMLTYLTDIGSFKDISLLTDGFDTQLTFIGIPGCDGGSSIIPTSQIAISDKSPHRDEAWEFIKMVLSEEYQDNVTYLAGMMAMPILPVRLSSLEKKAEDAQKTQILSDVEALAQAGKRKYRAATDEEIESVWNLIKGCKRIYTDNLINSIISIVCEESEDYLSGKKVLSDVIPVIESRVSLKLSEGK